MAYNGLLRRASSEDDYATLVRINLQPRARPAPAAAAAAAAAAATTASAQHTLSLQRPAAGVLGFSSKEDPLGVMQTKGSLGLKALGGGLSSAPGSMEFLEDSAMHAMNHIYDAMDFANRAGGARGVKTAYKADGTRAIVAVRPGANGLIGTAPKIAGKRSFRKAAAARIALQQEAGVGQ